MDEIKSIGETWEDMEVDVLVKIFKELNMIELAMVSQVCRSWFLACSDSLLWSILNLGLLKSNFIQTMASPYVWVEAGSDWKLTYLLVIAMALSDGNISCLIFQFNQFMRNDLLNYITERCPHLKRLVMPAWDLITKTGIFQPIRRYAGIPDDACQFSPLMEWRKYVGLRELLFSQDCGHLRHLICYNNYLLPPEAQNIECTMLYTDEAWIVILDCKEHLEVLNVSPFMLLENLGFTGGQTKISRLDCTVLEKASRLREFYHCMESSCLVCQRMMTRDEGHMRWFRCKEWFWRQDEVSSLDLGNDFGKLFD